MTCMSQRLIEFHAPAHLLEHLPHPIPAAQSVPEWFRRMPSQTESNQNIFTVKSCAPFLEAMTFGYIIGVPTDITFLMEGDRLRVDVAGFDVPMVDLHGGDQVPGAPYSGMPVVTFRTPWLIRTPKEYSTLVLPPLNRFEMPFVPLSGVVETDTYYRQVAFPSLCMMTPGQQVKLVKGMPLVQVVPVLREAWLAQVGASDVEANKAQDAEWEKNHHMYRDQHWQKKSFR